MDISNKSNEDNKSNEITVIEVIEGASPKKLWLGWTIEEEEVEERMELKAEEEEVENALGLGLLGAIGD